MQNIALSLVVCHLARVKLTFYADDFRPVPLAVGTTLSSGHMALQEPIGALVAHHGVDVIVGALPTNQEGVIHSGWGSTKHCRMEERDRILVRCLFIFISLCVIRISTQDRDFYLDSSPQCA